MTLRGGRCGVGAQAPWRGRLWSDFLNYAPTLTQILVGEVGAASDKLNLTPELCNARFDENSNSTRTRGGDDTGATYEAQWL